MEVKPGYKQTEVGVIPQDWDALNLGLLVKLQGGYSFRSQGFSDIGVSVIRISDIQCPGRRPRGGCDRSQDRSERWQRHGGLCGDGWDKPFDLGHGWR